ncbi:glucuronyl hydrolase [Maribellus comscasis]|uniref:Glucuronyl hydrolase n=1 Tax=Maribellus comscasis TaxID=2681766 RepID=A0A6I6JXE3_9BACT|nr:glycoside hydrolase family 88 protein [Maribellus comscasis]QGY47221.1 glucuronyl hydrolase [Maribellus comscasis]
MKNSVYGILLIMIFTVACSSNKISKEDFDIDKMLDYAVKKAEITMNSLKTTDSLPRNIENNQTNWNKVDIYDWTSGFWPGILWYAYEKSGDSLILENARIFSEVLKGVLDVPVYNHDLGFMFYCSLGNGLRLTGDKQYHEILMAAADSLATLYNPKVGTILSWPQMREKMNWPHNTIIDNMMNLELLFWAAKNSDRHNLYDIAVKHAETTMRTLVRPDFTTYHVAIFDTIDGHFIKGVTHQGFSDSSMWARGQGWGIYGFTMTYRETGDEKFLTTACRLADVFIEQLPEDGIPYWDFDDPAIPNAPKDVSAAAIAASGMLELSTFMKEEKQKIKYRNAAIGLLKRISSDKYLSMQKNKAMLMHSTGNYPNGSEIDASIIYADYYYVEALLRLGQHYSEISNN